jgi:aspartate/tyrosine/aromatic aminotransferase
MPLFAITHHSTALCTCKPGVNNACFFPNTNRGGDATFCQLTRKLAFGEDCPATAAGRIATVQTLSGTGALRVGGEFLKKHYAVKVVYLPDPTW